jgi:hypothetical protein
LIFETAIASVGGGAPLFLIDVWMNFGVRPHQLRRCIVSAVLVLVFVATILNGTSGAGVSVHSLQVPVKDMQSCAQAAKKAEVDFRSRQISVATSCFKVE